MSILGKHGDEDGWSFVGSFEEQLRQALGNPPGLDGTDAIVREVARLRGLVPMDPQPTHRDRTALLDAVRQSRADASDTPPRLDETTERQ